MHPCCATNAEECKLRARPIWSKPAELDFGETNIGMFMLKSEAMFQALIDLKQRYWNETDQRYERPRRRAGFSQRAYQLLRRADAWRFRLPNC